MATAVAVSSMGEAARELTAHVVAEIDTSDGEAATVYELVARRPGGRVGAPVYARADRAAAACNLSILGVDHRGDPARHEAGVPVGDPRSARVFAMNDSMVGPTLSLDSAFVAPNSAPIGCVIGVFDTGPPLRSTSWLMCLSRTALAESGCQKVSVLPRPRHR
jgi:hypothetical protein